MATLEELSTALRNADAAGDAESARILASEITRLRSKPTEDPVMKRAREEFAADKARGIPVEVGAGRRFLQGATLNTADEIIAGLATPLEMIKRGTFNPIEAYQSAKAAQDVALEDARQNGGVLGTIAEIGGGVMSGAGLGGAGITAARALPATAGLLPRIGASAADAAVMGGVAGFADGSGTEDRLSKGLLGAALGGVVGGLAPVAISLGQQALNPIISNIRARLNPEGFARNQVARGVFESGQTPAELANAVRQASDEGQGMFTLADAMGNSGQRMLATTARSPGIARTRVVDFLDGRQAGQGRRLANTLAEGFDSPQTAAQVRDRMTAARDAAADAEYSAVRADAGPVDLSRTIARIDDTLSPGVNQIVAPANNIANDSVESALQSFRNRLTDGQSVLTDFTAVQRVRGDLSDAIEAARRDGQGNKARLLGQALREMDAAMEAASQGHRQANRNFAQASRNIDAIDAGRTAALRGRSEDTIPAFRALNPQGQQAFRAGYSDPLIEQVQGGAFGANKARPLTSDAFMDEAAAIAPMRTGPLMQRRIDRENTMFQTRNAATGNSKTVENSNDDAAMGVDMTMIGNIMSGNYTGALRSAMNAISNGWNGNTAGVREEVARILLQRGQNVNPAAIQRMLDETMRRIEQVSNIARQIGRGGSGGLAVAPGATGNRR